MLGRLDVRPTPVAPRRIHEHYTSSTSGLFPWRRFKYSKAFLQWALQGPGFVAEWHVGVRVAANQKLVRPLVLASPDLNAVAFAPVRRSNLDFGAYAPCPERPVTRQRRDIRLQDVSTGSRREF